MSPIRVGTVKQVDVLFVEGQRTRACPTAQRANASKVGLDGANAFQHRGHLFVQSAPKKCSICDES